MHAIELHRIRVDGGTQPRVAIDPATVDEYVEAMERGMRFPPLVVYFDGENAWLADGFHRYYAARKLGTQAMDVDWREGTLEMAKLYAAGANADHGLRRTAGDKRRAIEMALSTNTGRGWTQEQIAKHCDVSRSWVSQVLAQYRTDNSAPPATKREQTRAAIDVAIEMTPTASDRQLARELGVNRRTVIKARARAKPAPASASPSNASSSPAPSHGYSSPARRDAAARILDAVRVACATWSDADWNLLVRQLADVRRKTQGCGGVHHGARDLA